MNSPADEGEIKQVGSPFSEASAALRRGGLPEPKFKLATESRFTLSNAFPGPTKCDNASVNPDK